MNAATNVAPTSALFKEKLYHIPRRIQDERTALASRPTSH